MIIILKQIDIEGPETIGEFFKTKGYLVQEINLYTQAQIPQCFEDIDAVICLGGPMNVYEDTQYQFLKQEDVFIKEILKRDIPFLGICLGAQLLAKACSANVVKSPQKEIGFSPVMINGYGKEDPIFAGMPDSFMTYQWHEDMFHVPEGGKLLASSTGCPHQAFRIGNRAYGFQFHIEITDKSIREWSDCYFKEVERGVPKQKMLNDYMTVKQEFDRSAIKIYENFYQIMTTQ